LENVSKAPKYLKPKESSRLNSNISRFNPKSQKIRV